MNEKRNPLTPHGDMLRTFNKEWLDESFTFRDVFRFKDPRTGKQKYNNFELINSAGHTYYIIPKFFIRMLQHADISNGCVSGKWRFQVWHGWTSIEYLGP